MVENNINSIAEQYLKLREKQVGVELQYYEEETIETDDFVVYFYDTKKYLETDDSEYMMAGNAPIIISKKDGKIYVSGTAYPIEHYIENFKKYGNPHATQPEIDDDYKPVDDPRVMTKKEVEDYINEITYKHNKDR